MKSILTAAAAAVVLTAGSAMAWEGRTVACFDKHWVPPTYKTHKVLVKHAKERYEHKHGRIELVHYAPVYREHKSLASKGYWVMKEVSCGCPKC
ncbi:MAG: hypothetical protein QNJ16_10795 [Rhodobacter sp.]|nr:hypothetical protein [Rhodobacter sp.]